MSLNSYGIASVIFLILYSILFAYLIFGYATKRFHLKSRWTLLLFHVTIRLAAQGVALGFSIKGFEAPGLLIAVLVLSAEGYFSLMMCLLRLLISWQRRYLPERHSWLAGPKNPPQLSMVRRVIEGLTLVGIARTPINALHWILVIANVMIVVGGSILAGDSDDASQSSFEDRSDVQTSKALRGAGQGIFLVTTIVIFACIVYTFINASRRSASSDERKRRPVLIVMLVCAPFMFTRGIFGLLQALVSHLNYYNPDVYTDGGFTQTFAVEETCCATMCEWITCALLLSTSFMGLSGKSAEAQERQRQLSTAKENGSGSEDAASKQDIPLDHVTAMSERV